MSLPKLFVCNWSSGFLWVSFNIAPFNRTGTWALLALGAVAVGCVFACFYGATTEKPNVFIGGLVVCFATILAPLPFSVFVRR